MKARAAIAVLAAALLAGCSAGGDDARGGRTGDDLTLVADASQGDRDRYDRLLRYVEHDGDDLARAMIAAGWAAVYRTREPFARQEAYRAAAAAARGARRGVWVACGGDFHRPAG